MCVRTSSQMQTQIQCSYSQTIECILLLLSHDIPSTASVFDVRVLCGVRPKGNYRTITEMNAYYSSKNKNRPRETRHDTASDARWHLAILSRQMVVGMFGRRWMQTEWE